MANSQTGNPLLRNRHNWKFMHAGHKDSETFLFYEGHVFVVNFGNFFLLFHKSVALSFRSKLLLSAVCESKDCIL